MRLRCFSKLKSVSLNPNVSFYNCIYFQKYYFSEIKTYEFSEWFKLEHELLNKKTKIKKGLNHWLHIKSQAEEIEYATSVVTERIQDLKFKTIFKNSKETRAMYGLSFKIFWNSFELIY